MIRVVADLQEVAVVRKRGQIGPAERTVCGHGDIVDLGIILDVDAHTWYLGRSLQNLPKSDLSGKLKENTRRPVDSE